MKKTLVALAALAATSAFAQSSVTLSGLVDAGYQSINFKGQSQNGIANNGRSTSTIQISGEEVIDGGYKASFKLNSDFDPTRGQANAGTNGTAGTSTASTWLNSEKFVALSGGFGELRAGVVNNKSLETFGIGANFGTAFGSGFRYVVSTDVLGVLGTGTITNGTVSTANASAVRHDKSFSYTTPVIAGLSATAYAVKKNTNANVDTFSSTQHNYNLAGMKEYQIKYSNGPLNVAYVTQAQDNTGVAAVAKQYTTKLNTLGANFTAGPIKVYAMNQAASADSVNTGLNVYKTSYRSVGVDFTMGATTLKAQMGRLKNLKQVDGTDDSTKLAAVGADYAFGKRTTLYARYERMTDAGSNLNGSYPSNLGYNKTNTDGNITRSAIGVVHTF